MTASVDAASGRAPGRTARPRRYLMAPPTYFAVDYAINPWMDTDIGVDTALATAQWQRLRDTYLRLGHTVDVVDPVAGLPDMVYTANAGLIVGEAAIVARFKHPQRARESDVYERWMIANGYRPVSTRHANEGQGDLLLVGAMLLGGAGPRTDLASHSEIADIVGLPVVSLELVDPRFYHLDTALTVLDDTTIAYYPPAFSSTARARVAELFPGAITVTDTDADVLGLNAVSDGYHVVYPCAASGFADQLRAKGFDPISADMSELLKGGGSVKCCTLEVYS